MWKNHDFPNINSTILVWFYKLKLKFIGCFEWFSKVYFFLFLKLMLKFIENPINHQKQNIFLNYGIPRENLSKKILWLKYFLKKKNIQNASVRKIGHSKISCEIILLSKV